MEVKVLGVNEIGGAEGDEFVDVVMVKVGRGKGEGRIRGIRVT